MLLSQHFKSLILFAIIFIREDFGLISSTFRNNFTGIFGHKTDNCFDDPIEQRVRKSDFVFTGTIREIRTKNPDSKSALVEIKRVFKGENRLDLLILTEVQGKILPVKYKVGIVEGFDNENFCFKLVQERDTWLFFTNAGEGKLFLNSSLAKLSIVNIAKTEAASKGQQYISPKITYFSVKDQNECPNKTCPFGGQCYKNLISGYYQCRCMFECGGEEQTVCGSDGETYKNDCQLRKTSCLMKKVIAQKHEGICEARDSCLNVKCMFGSKCVSRGPSYACLCTKNEECDQENNNIEGILNRQFLCGTDGKEYQNECELNYKMCLTQKKINISHYGSCDPCHNLVCYFGASCIIHNNKMASCACQQNCTQIVQKQCGSDGVNYDNICFMNRASCLKQQEIQLLHNGPCPSTCEDEECENGSTCIEGKCVCQSNCSTEEDPVCGTDGLTHINECALYMLSCNQRLPITVAYHGDCEEDVDVEANKCEIKKCFYGGRCEFSQVGDEMIEECFCSFRCDEERMSVCGSDKRIYLNECYLMRSSCRKQIFIQPQPMQFCQGSFEEFCDGFAIVQNESTGEDLQCAGHVIDDCPPQAYCHIIYNEGRCCEGYQVVTGCKMSKYGCCADMVTVALGPDYFGCDINDEMACQCNPFGSVEVTCDQNTRRCSCKLNVAGLRCDRCESNFWGFLRITDGEDGCQACDCNEYGSTRDDCDQMTGQCMCLASVMGVKCDQCHDGSPISDRGCSNEQKDLNLSSQKFSTMKSKIFSKHDKNRKTNKIKQIKSTKNGVVFNQTKHPKVIQNFNLSDIVSESNDSDTKELQVSLATNSSQSITPSTHHQMTDDASSIGYTTPYFNGDSYINLKPLTHGSRDINIEIGFRSLSMNGLLFYAGHFDNKKGDFISIAIVNGSLEFRYDLGSGSTTLKIASGVKLNHLHRASAVRHGRDGLLKLDEEFKDAGLSPGQIRSLDMELPIYLGSVPDKSLVEQRNVHVMWGFHGCIDFLKIISSELNYEYDLCKSSSLDILSDRKTYDCRNSCADYQCIKDGACQSDKEIVFACKCPERNYGLRCEFGHNSVEGQNRQSYKQT